MTLLRLALASHRGGLVAATAMASLIALGNTIAFAQIAGSTPAERAVFAQQMEILGRQISYLLPLPVQLDTMSGYVHWRHFGNLPLVYGFWALMAASGAGRGDEERGMVEHWLSAGVSRGRYLLARVVAFALVAALSIGIMLAAVVIGAAIGSDSIPAGALAQQGVALLALALCCFGIALTVAQLTGTRRAAAGYGGVLLLVLFLVNSAARTDASFATLARLSPFWAYERNTPLLRGGALDLAAVTGLLAAAAVLVVIGAAAFARRDVGATLFRPRLGSRSPTDRPSRDPLLRVPVLAGMDQQRLWIAGWMLGLAALAAFFVSLTRTIVDVMLATPVLRAYMERLGGTTYDLFVGVMWSSTTLLLLSLFAIAQVNGWVADDAEGRLESVLAQPLSRTRVVVERLGVLAGGAALLIAVGAAAALATAAARDIPLDRGGFVLGSALMLAVALVFGAIGAAVAGWRPRLAVPLLTIVAFVSYFTQQFAPLFNWPELVEDLSLYSLYGRPIGGQIEWGGIATLLTIGGLGTVLATRSMRHRDIGS